MMLPSLAFSTTSGSHYELDTDRHRIRRLRGSHPPTPRQAADTEWRCYHAVALVWYAPAEPRPSLLIIWDAAGAATVTSMLPAADVKTLAARLAAAESTSR
jgi:hypothetical protein